MPRGTLRQGQHRPDAPLASGAKIRRTVEAGSLFQDDKLLRKYPGRMGRDARNMPKIRMPGHIGSAAQGCATAFGFGSGFVAGMAVAVGNIRILHGFRDDFVALP